MPVDEKKFLTPTKKKVVYTIQAVFVADADDYGNSIQDVLDRIREDCEAEIIDITVVEPRG